MSWRRLAVATMFERMPLAVAVAEPSGLALYANPAFRRLLGMAPGPWQPRDMALLRAPDAVHDVVIRHDIARRGFWEEETRLVTSAGTEVAVWESVHLVEADASALHVHFVQDLTAVKRVEELNALAFYDSLTGLPNRNLLADRLSSAMRRAQRNGKTFALLYIDIDGLKTVNDNAGHAAGDEFLRTVARGMQQALRKRDTVARLGGDEFVVIVEEVNGERAAAKIADKLLAACRRTFPGDPQRQVSASAGVSFFPRHGANMDALLERADAALYRAKACGRNCYVFAEDLRMLYRVTDGGGRDRN